MPNQHIRKFEDVVIQIATPYNSGSGFFYHDLGLVISNYHVVGDSPVVTVNGTQFDKCLGKVVFKDKLHDIAFIKLPVDVTAIPAIALAEVGSIRVSEDIYALGHPFNMDYTVNSGTVSRVRMTYENRRLVQLNIALNPGNSGGPSVNTKGHVVGINTAIIDKGEGIGLAIPVDDLYDAIQIYATGAGERSVRCQGCRNLITESDSKAYDHHCPVCGHESVFGTENIYDPIGKVAEIESVFRDLGKQVDLSRCGRNAWEFAHGSANIFVSYSERSGRIIGDAQLCQLPRKNVARLYDYLLKKNHELEGLTFSVNGSDIVLSCVIIDKYFNSVSAKRMFQNLFEQADHYDDILVDEFGASFKQQKKPL